MKVFAILGFRVEEAVDDEGGDTPPVIRCRKRGTYTLVEFEEPVGDGNLFRRIRFSADIELPETERRRMKDRADAPQGGEPVATGECRPFLWRRGHGGLVD